MVTEVDKYRGWAISFSTEDEKFIAYSNVHDKEVEKGSYTTIKKFIDDFIKENQAFKPFYVESSPDSYMFRQTKHLKIIGIRKDGIFVSEDKDGKKTTISKYDEMGLMLVNPKNKPTIAKYNTMMAESQKIADEAKEYLMNNVIIKKLEDYRKEI